MKDGAGVEQTDKSSTSQALLSLEQLNNFIKISPLKHKVLMKICLNQHGVSPHHTPVLSPTNFTASLPLFDDLFIKII
jgi:hypothetical protein